MLQRANTTSCVIYISYDAKRQKTDSYNYQKSTPNIGQDIEETNHFPTLNPTVLILGQYISAIFSYRQVALV